MRLQQTEWYTVRVLEWLLILVVFYEITSWMTNRWGGG